MPATSRRAITTLTPAAPYDFHLTAAYATYFRGRYGADSFEDGAFRRALDIGGRLYLATVRSPGTADSPLLELEISGAVADEETVATARRQVSWVLGLDQDLAPFHRMALEDPLLAPLAKALWGLHVPRTLSVFEGLVLAILGQQISSDVARMLRTLLIQTYGPCLEIAGVSYHAFPCPEVLAAAGAEGLRSIKLSTRKANYIVDIAARVASGELDLEGLRALPAEAAVSTMTAIKGVGPWTAHWLLVRALGHSDGFPHDDLALRRTLGVLLKREVPLRADEALEYSRRWSPYRSYAVAYLFAVARSGILAPPAPAAT